MSVAGSAVEGAAGLVSSAPLPSGLLVRATRPSNLEVTTSRPESVGVGGGFESLTAPAVVGLPAFGARDANTEAGSSILFGTVGDGNVDGDSGFGDRGLGALSDDDDGILAVPAHTQGLGETKGGDQAAVNPMDTSRFGAFAAAASSGAALGAVFGALLGFA